MTDCVDGLLDDFPGQPRSHRPDVDRLIDESGGRNADVLDSLDSSRMLHGEFLSVFGYHEQYHRAQWTGNLSPAPEWSGSIAADRVRSLMASRTPAQGA